MRTSLNFAPEAPGLTLVAALSPQPFFSAHPHSPHWHLALLATLSGNFSPLPSTGTASFWLLSFLMAEEWDKQRNGERGKHGVGWAERGFGCGQAEFEGLVEVQQAGEQGRHGSLEKRSGQREDFPPAPGMSSFPAPPPPPRSGPYHLMLAPHCSLLTPRLFPLLSSHKISLVSPALSDHALSRRLKTVSSTFAPDSSV